jgi:phosphohistidine swiveling domain-containing protein
MKSQSLILNLQSPIDDYQSQAGGKALNLYKMIKAGIPVPDFIVVSNSYFQEFLKENALDKIVNSNLQQLDFNSIETSFINASFSKNFTDLLAIELHRSQLTGHYLAIRSSGADEDSKDHSFAGMFSSFLFKKSMEEILLAIKKCWASAFTPRNIEYRLKNGLSLENIKMGVVIQKMVDSEVSGVLFTRNPINLSDTQGITIEAVYGQCEGLVSGQLDSDKYYVMRNSPEIKKHIVPKTQKFIKDPQSENILLTDVSHEQQSESCLSNQNLKELEQLAYSLESYFHQPMDCEWAYENNRLFVVQMRPITNVPPLGFYDSQINGQDNILWDNSNIVESFSGVTTPLTFSLTKEAYAIVYRQSCRLLRVPESIITQFDESYKNMLGFIRGRVYYNLINWYKLLFIIPGSASNKEFMETMMGVKEHLTPKQQELFNFINQTPQYSFFKKIEVVILLLHKFLIIDKMVNSFNNYFHSIYYRYLEYDFSTFSLSQLKKAYQEWDAKITYEWKTPIINDFLVMVFYGTLKKLTQKWLPQDQSFQHLQNDLMCGQGELESAKPTLRLMELAEKYDHKNEWRDLFLTKNNEEIFQLLSQKDEQYKEIATDIQQYLKLYGFRCSNEQKLEEPDLNDNPLFLFESLRNYIKNKKYSISEMKARESEIKMNAELKVKKSLTGIRKIIYFWVLKHARNAVKNRENLRFLRSKSFGITRKIFKAMGHKLHALDLLQTPKDIYYLTYREIFDFIDGSAESLSLKQLSQVRKNEFLVYLNEDQLPDRFFTVGVTGANIQNIKIIQDADLLKQQLKKSDDPSIEYGISCCPGIVRGKVRIALNLEDAKNLQGEILLTKRTDPGWVPLFPSLSGLIVERGSLLSHSAVVAREMGLPTIVGISSDIFKKLKDGDEIELNATEGKVKILNYENT